MPRDRFATRALILDSAASIIAAGGVAELGVNALADAAKCDKVLIYRYFGGLDGVLAALAEERMLWPHVVISDEPASGDDSLADAVQSLMLEEWAALSSGTLMLAATSAEHATASAILGAAVSAQRSERHAAMIATLKERYRIPPYVDLPALVELLSAALTSFALRAAHAPSSAIPAQSFDPASPQGWRRMEKMIGAITRALLNENGR